MESDILSKSKINENGFWFIDIPRTSSSSIKVELGKEFGFPYGKSNLLEQQFSSRQVIPDHIPVKQMREFLGAKEWEDLYSFTFVRNPWDRMVSMYFYRLLKGHYSNSLTFRDYILQLKLLAEGGRPALFGQYFFYLACSDYIFDGDNCLVSYVGRYENRANDLDEISSVINCPGLGKLFLQKAAADKEHYSYYYDEETKEIIGKIYQSDAERFGYQFEIPQ